MNTTLLQLNSSIHGAAGQSSQLASELVARWKAQHPKGTVLVRDLNADPLPHLTAERFQAFLTKAGNRTPEQERVIAQSDALISELKRADVIVIGLPMYNFDVPSTVKAYFDHIARAGVTFRYTANGSVGLLTGKKVYVIATRGGLYAGSPTDTQSAYVRQFLHLLGIEDVEFVYAEGLAISDASSQAALAQAREVIEGLSIPEPAAIAA